ncbi:DUF1847 domain-containing protein [Desulfofalx alkaliphila]|uniref:DUF1847 domain-containing protein n=1 Tax=Desulfofalx alkaliphila TaxID=105483 RepID=UPI0004E1B073|nr:DUF1847 domain-containing protein [Desulfofalx alkaliphila]
MKCADCKQKPKNRCNHDGYDCTGGKLDCSAVYHLDENKGPHRISGYLQHEYGNDLTRLEETIKYCQKMGYKKIGIAFCVGLAEESVVIAHIFESYNFKVASVCCKLCGLDKKDYDVPNVNPEKLEIHCNPVGQAEILNRSKVDFNIEVGLCVGHDVLFKKYAKAPVTVLAVKDRLMAHNPLGVIYSSYWRKKFKVK